MLLSIRAPQTNTRGPRYMEKALAAIHEADVGRRTITLIYGREQHQIGLYLEVPGDLGQEITDLLSAKYPNCQIEPALDVLEPPAGWSCYSAELRLEPELFPILRHVQYEDLLNGTFEDPIDAILKSIRPEEATWSRVEIAITPASRHRSRLARKAVWRLDRPFFRSHPRVARFYARHLLSRMSWPLATLVGLAAFSRGPALARPLDASSGRFHEREEDVHAAGDKVGWHLFQARVRLVVFVPAGDRHVARAKLRSLRGALGSFTRSRLSSFRMSRVQRGKLRRLDPRRGFLLSHEELATLFHPPTENVSIENVQTTTYRELPPPALLGSGTGDGEVVLGRMQYRGDDRLFGIAAEDRRRHCYIVGKTGMGKTTLLENMIRSDIAAEHGVALIDPHGDLFEEILDGIPSARTNDVVVMDPADPEYALSFNPLCCSDPEKRDQVASGVVSAFKKIYDSWGPRLEDTLRNAVYLAIEHRGTFHTVLRILSDEAFRLRLTSHIEDPIARHFWEGEFERWNDRYRTEATAAILNKLRPFLMSRRIRAIIAQGGRSLDLRRVMDEGKVLLVNLSKGRIGEDNSNLLGALLVTSLQQAAMSRADIAEAKRLDFYVYIDEFQNFSTGSFATILSEARKYRLAMTLSHQYLEQLDEKTADAVFGNVGSIISFQVGSSDARSLASQLSKYEGQIAPEDLANLPKYHAYIRLLQDGMPLPPFSMKTLPPRMIEEKRGAIVRRVSNARHAKSRDAVLSRLERDSSQQPNRGFAAQTAVSRQQISIA